MAAARGLGGRGEGGRHRRWGGRFASGLAALSALAPAIAAWLLPVALVPAAGACRRESPEPRAAVERTADMQGAPVPGERAGVAASPDEPPPRPPRRLTAGEADEAAAGIGRMTGVRTVHVWQHGELLAARGFRGADPAAPHDVMSASKSLLSALVGVALERGWLASLEQTVGDLLPRAAAQAGSEAKGSITIEDLLTMRSGLASTSGEHYGAWVAGGDWVLGALRRPLEHEPGTTFTYSTGNTHLLSAILTAVAGRSTRDVAEEEVLGPLGVKVHGWLRGPAGVDFGGNGVRLTPEGLGRFGQLYLQEGQWEGRQLVPASWVERSTRARAEGWPDRYGRYGYLWWVPDEPAGSFLAVGYGGQFLHVFPPAETVVVVTSTVAAKGVEWDRQAIGLIAGVVAPLVAEAPAQGALPEGDGGE